MQIKGAALPKVRQCFKDIIASQNIDTALGRHINLLFALGLRLVPAPEFV